MMKFLAILFLAGFASASLLERVARDTRDIITAFENGIQTATPLHIALGIENDEDVQRVERDIKEELKKHIKEEFEKTLKKIEDADKEGKEINPEALKLLKDLRDKMEDLNIGNDEIKDLDDMKKKVSDQLKEILKKMGLFSMQSTSAMDDELFMGVLGDLSIRDMFVKLKDMVLEKLDVSTIKVSLAKVIGQTSQTLCEWITNKGKEKVMDFFDRIVESGEQPGKRYAADNFEEIKDYLKNIEDNVENKLIKFRKWLHDLVEKGFEGAKEKVQKVAEIMKEIMNKNKKSSKEGVTSLLNYLHELEDAFGSVDDFRNVLDVILKSSN